MPKTQSISIPQAIENITKSDEFEKQITRDLLKQTLDAISSSLQDLATAPYASLTQYGFKTKESNELAQALRTQLHKKILKRVQRR